jgi:hypothetical protein
MSNQLRAAAITYSDGTVIGTSLAAHLTDSDIYKYFAIGKPFNIGSVKDNVQTVKQVKILR